MTSQRNQGGQHDVASDRRMAQAEPEAGRSSLIPFTETALSAPEVGQRVERPVRNHIGLETKLAAALCQMLRPDENGKLVPIIPHAHAKLMSPRQVLSLFRWDHYPIRHADGGPDEHWNLQPLLIAEHDEKTDTIDKPQIAKQKRLRGETCTAPAAKIPQRANAWPAKGTRKIQSRGFAT